MLALSVPKRDRKGILCSLIILAFTLLALSALPAQATTYYVSPSGSDTNPGTQAAPVRQIRDAIALVKPGDTVLVADGSYLGFDINSVNGTASAPITIQAQGNNAVVTVTTDRPDNRDTMFITYSSYIVLDGLNSFNANRAAIRIDNSPHITVENGVYGNNTEWGIFTDFSDDVLIENNECYGTKVQHGVYVSNTCVNPTVNHNQIHDNYACGLHMNGDVSEGGAGIITGALVENNIIYNNGAGGGSGINMDGVQNSIIVNNLLYNNHANGIAAYQIDASAGPKGDLFIYNTVDMASDSRWGLEIISSAGPNTVMNNILHNNNTSHGGLQYGSSTDVKNTTSDCNIQDKVSPDYGNTIYTLAQWQAKGYELHSLSATPASLWVSPSTYDYHLVSTAPAIGAGEGLAAVATDLDGNPRPASGASDIGCYEHTGSQVMALSSLSISPTSVTGGNSAQGTVTLNTAAPSGGVTVMLSNNSSAAVAPAMITISAGTTSVTFTISTQIVTANTTATLSASYNGVTKTATLTIQAPVTNPPPVLQSLTVSPTSVTGGSSAQGKITLSSAAPTGGCSIAVSSNNTAASVPASVNIAAGATSATFAISTTSVTTSTNVTFTASYNGVNKTATLTVQPAASATFVLGVCLGGPNGVTIEGNPWLSYSQALSNGLSVSNANVGQTNSVTFIPTPDAATAQMLSWCVWTHATSNGQGFTLKQTLPNGNYQVYLWEVEDGQDYARTMNVILNGVTVAKGIGYQPLGHWTKYGPYSASVSNGVLKIRVVRETMGNPQMMGLAIFKQ